MNPFRKVQQNLHHFFLKKKVAKLNILRTTTNLKQAKKIGILFNPSNEQDVKIINKYADELKANDKKVKLLGYRHSKSNFQSTLSFITEKDLNWLLEPKGMAVIHFISQPFDILINAYIKQCLPLEYIAALSKAKLRVGNYFHDKTYCFDLMIDTNNKDLNYFLTQTNHYLKNLKK